MFKEVVLYSVTGLLVLSSLTFISCGGVKRVVEYFIKKREEK